MIKWREVFGKAAFLILTTALPGSTVGIALTTGQVPYWPGVACAFVAWVMGIAYGVQRKRIMGYKLAITRMQAKRDATMTYLIRPEDTEDG